MTERERFFAVLDGRKPDRTPWYADMCYYFHYLQQTKQVPEFPTLEAHMQAYYDFCRKMGAGVISYASYPYRMVFDGGVEHFDRVEGDTMYSQWKTPVGTLTQTQTYSWNSFSHGITEHYVKTIDDLRVMTYIYEHTHYEPYFDDLRRQRELLGEDGVVMNLPPITVSAVQKLTSRWAGIENMIDFIYDEEEEFNECVEHIQASEAPAFDMICDFEEPFVEFCDNLSSEVTGGNLFRQYNMPYYQKINEKLHKAGKKTGIHIDGTLRPCLALHPKCGFDMAEAVTPAPVGDIQPEDLRAEVGEGFVICGAMPGALFSPQYSEEFFDEYLRRIAPIVKPGSGFMLGVADQVPPDGILSRMAKVRAMIDANV